MRVYPNTYSAASGSVEQLPESVTETYGVRRAIRVLKDAVAIEDYAGTVTALGPAGNALRGPCPIHKGNNPEAFVVYVPEQRFYCFRCNEGGDVVDLARAVEGGELWEAVVSLSERHGVKLPRRPERWHQWNDEKYRRRDELQRWRARRYQRRFYALFAAEAVAAIEDVDERTEEMNRCWAELGALARMWAARSMGC